MRAKTLQIIWHSKDPVFSIDFHPDGYIATGGGDKDIKLWELCCDNEGNPQVRYANSLSGHSRTINCVRFSHSGHCLASAGDSGELLIWRPAPGSAAAAAGAGSGGGHVSTPAPAAQKDSSTTGSLARSSSQALAAADEAGGAAAEGGLSAAAVGVWKLSASLRGHHDDVTDVSWAHDDAVIMSGSVENEVMMFDVEARRSLARLEGHRHYVQGVAWDPLGAWLVSQSADRTVRVHGLKPPPTGTKAAAAAGREGMRSSTALARDVLHTHTLSKVALQPPATPPQPGPDTTAAGAGAGAELASSEQQQQQQPVSKPLQAALFHDESLNTFFRRLAWSPEGALLAVPAGVYRQHAGQQQQQHATYVYARGHWGCPLLSLPCPSKASTAVRFCPCIFKLRPPQQQQQQQQVLGSNGGGTEQQQGAAAVVSGDAVNVLGLPYRLVLAVATMDSVLLYDMQTCEPMLLVGPLHFAPITDIAWSRDGSCLAVSSHDGYCSIVTFQPGELGDVMDDSSLPEGVQAALSKVQAAAAATAAKGGSTASGLAATAAAATPRPAGAAAAGAANTPKAGQQQQQQQVSRPPNSSPANATAGAAAGSQPAGAGLPSTAAAAAAAVGGPARPRRVTPQSVTADQATTTPMFGAAAAPTHAAATVAPAAAAAAAPTVGAVRPRRLTPQLVAAEQTTAAPAFGAVAPAPAPAASAGVAGTNPTSGQQAAQQQQQPAAKAKPAVAAPKAAAAAAPAGGGGGGASARVGLAAVQAALAAAKKKRAAAQLAAEGGGGGAGGGGGGGDDDVVIVAEVAAGDAGTNKRTKLQ